MIGGWRAKNHLSTSSETARLSYMGYKPAAKTGEHQSTFRIECSSLTKMVKLMDGLR